MRFSLFDSFEILIQHFCAAFDYGMTTGFYQVLFYVVQQVHDLSIFFTSKNAYDSVQAHQLTHVHPPVQCVFAVF